MIFAQIRDLKQRKAELLSAAASLDDAIKALEGNQEKPIDWKNSALDCLKIHVHPLRTIDIFNCMCEKDKKLNITEPIKRRNYINALSIALNAQCDNGLLYRMSLPGFKGFFYGFKTWFTNKNELKEEVERALKYNLWENQKSVFQLTKIDKSFNDNRIEI
ncbi:hypothetical protein BDD43_3687 [Mucilaginibacter gracilis]|uniref:Uncharacterized protein n=2 Tax=Mucilaginibacter gracilis TaxID=423350 RepID=A0A495J4Z9_9SPHI|nr:hypothetical protein BDD43_3687 [Mucilaginibacter gracilis]